ncbi:uncharacterized protein LOC100374715 [Saccoglossus kowalevskii]|uniref:Uncharacterized protein LOC100374715 n=1 Tax=Saccoglossus kowalevskii TaxID=10224 RepID=A0ABM0GKS8_SACKO|nr:PREDICTED: uncharacterized protein LOC100374715 [Saccoglossus kowalevskii]
MGNIVVYDGCKRQVPNFPWKPFPEFASPEVVALEITEEDDSRLDDTTSYAPDAGRVVLKLDPVPSVSDWRSQTQDLLWWTYAQFMPGDDSQLLTSVGVYVPRPGRTITGAHRHVQGRISLWNLSTQPADSTLLCQRGSATWPHCQVSPESKYLCYIGRGEMVTQSLKDAHRDVKRRDLRMGNFRFCAVAPNGQFVAILMRVGNNFELATAYLPDLRSNEAVFCHNICPNFVGTANYSDHVECTFSPNSKFIAVSSSFGKLFVVKRDGLALYRLVTPGLVSLSKGLLEDARTYDFDPRYNYKMLAFSTSDKHLRVFNLETEQCVLDEELPIDVGAAEVLKYTHDGNLLAVATISTEILMYNTESGIITYKLNPDTQDPKYGMGAMPNGYPCIIRLSFSHSGEQLAVCSADGYIRIWQLPRFLNLQHFCRLTILRHFPANKVYSLPLPSKLVSYILYNPTR